MCRLYRPNSAAVEASPAPWQLLAARAWIKAIIHSLILLLRNSPAFSLKMPVKIRNIVFSFLCLPKSRTFSGMDCTSPSKNFCLIKKLFGMKNQVGNFQLPLPQVYLSRVSLETDASAGCSFAGGQQPQDLTAPASSETLPAQVGCRG